MKVYQQVMLNKSANLARRGEVVILWSIEDSDLNGYNCITKDTQRALQVIWSTTAEEHRVCTPA